jgi:uncharacterized phage protein gp47/JayE
MPFEIPSPDQIAARIAAELEAQIAGADATSSTSVLAALARSMALATYPVHLFGQWLADQVLPDVADEDWLERHASLWGVPRRPATVATGRVALSGLPGVVLPAGALLSLSGLVYQTLADVTLSAGGTGTVAVAAVETGPAGTQPPGARMTLAVPVTGLDPAVTVSDDGDGGGMTGGMAAEAVSLWRDRLIDRIQAPPHGGAASDYILWARQVPGVTQVAVYPEQFGPGTVGVCFAVSGSSPVASADQISQVRDHIDLHRPVTARVSVYAVTPVPLDITVEVRPDSAEVRADVANAIAAWFSADCTIGGTAYLSRLSEGISSGRGEYAHRITLPSAPALTVGAGQMLVPGSLVIGPWP